MDLSGASASGDVEDRRGNKGKLAAGGGLCQYEDNIAPLLDALRTLGVDIAGDAMPFRVRGTGTVKGGTVAIDASASSQFVSGLLLSGAAFDDGVTVGAGAGLG